MIIGRDKEQRELHEAYESEYSEFAVVYGRRRVGKTFLVRETFNYTFTFEHSGVAKGNMRVQLRAFRDSLADAGMGKVKFPTIGWRRFPYCANSSAKVKKGRKWCLLTRFLGWTHRAPILYLPLSTSGTTLLRRARMYC